MSEEKKEDSIYDENAVDGTIENLDPLKFADFQEKTARQMINMGTMQNPLGDMIKGLTSMVTGRSMSQKLTLSGMVGESQISVEITDQFSASMAHDIINKVMEEKRTTKGKEKSEQDIFEAMMKDSKKSKLLD